MNGLFFICFSFNFCNSYLEVNPFRRHLKMDVHIVCITK